MIRQIEVLRRNSISELYEKSIPKTLQHLQGKLDRAELDIELGKVHFHYEVERFFKSQGSKLKKVQLIGRIAFS